MAEQDSDHPKPSWGMISHRPTSQEEVTERLQAGIEFTGQQLASTAPKARFTTMFRQQLGWLCEGSVMVGGHVRHWPFFPILHEIAAIEGRRSSSMRPQSQFVGGHLHGLWHKHFFSAANIASNMVRELDQNFDYLWHGIFAKKLREVTGRSWEGGEVDEVTINLLTHTMTQQAYLHRRGALRRGTVSRMTGDWVVYYQDERGCIYITLAAHAEEHHLETVARRVHEAGAEYQELRDLLSRNGFAPT